MMSALASVVDLSAIGWQLVLLAQVAELNSKLLFLAMGIATFAGGVLLLAGNKRDVDQVMAGDRSAAYKRLEKRKFYRRAVTSCMIALIGCLIAACYWVSDRRVAAGLLLAIFTLVIGVVTLTLVDFLAIGVRRLVRGNRDSEKAMLEEIVKRHRESQETTEEQSS